MYIKDNMTGTVRMYGTNHHDALLMSEDGKFLFYENLQNGDGTRGGGYSFVTDERGLVPKDDEDLEEPYAYVNIGGIDVMYLYNRGYEQAKTDIIAEIEAKKACMKEHGVDEEKIVGMDAFKALVKHVTQ